MKFILLVFLMLPPMVLSAKKDPILATVNGQNILQSEFLKAFRQNKLFVSNKVVTKQKVLNDLISRIIGVERAKKNKIAQDPVILEKIEDILYHAQISKDLENKLKKIRITNQDVKHYYRQNKEYRTAQILLRVKADASPEEVNKTLKIAQEIYAKVKKSPDQFSEFANRYSQSGNAKTGGDMGFQTPMRYAPEYFAAIKGKKIGHLSPPVRTQYGFHLIKMLSVKKFKDINLGIYKKIIYDQKRDSILQLYFQDLRKGAKIAINKKALKAL